MKRYVVRLTPAERTQLELNIKGGKASADINRRSRILLKSDQSNDRDWMTDKEIARALDVCVVTVERIRKKFVLEGLEATLVRASRQVPLACVKVNGRVEAQTIAIATSPAPEGRCKWTLQLIADKLVELKCVDSISHTTVGKVLKKTNLNLGKRSNGV